MHAADSLTFFLFDAKTNSAHLESSGGVIASHPTPASPVHALVNTEKRDISALMVGPDWGQTSVWRVRRVQVPLAVGESRPSQDHLRSQPYDMIQPPSTLRVWPVMKDASGPARKATAAANSSRVPRRGRAWDSRTRCS